MHLKIGKIGKPTKHNFAHLWNKGFYTHAMLQPLTWTEKGFKNNKNKKQTQENNRKDKKARKL